MKQFVLKLVIYIVLLSGIIFGLNEIYEHQPRSYDKFVKGVPDNIQICNLGSSYGLNDFFYADIEKEYTCFNFAMGSQNLLYDCRILEHYRNKLQKGAVVFIVLSHFSFFGKPAVMGENFASMNKRYYKFLPPQLIEAYDKKTDFFVNYMPVLVIGSNIRQFVQEVFLVRDNGDDITTPEAAKTEGPARFKAFFTNMVDEYGKKILNHEALDSLYKIIDICRDIDARPILVTTPYLKEYNDAIPQNDSEFYSDFYAVINEIVRDTGLKYYDYSQDERFIKNHSLFINQDHLNRKGARLFTNILLSEVLGITP